MVTPEIQAHKDIKKSLQFIMSNDINQVFHGASKTMVLGLPKLSLKHSNLGNYQI